MNKLRPELPPLTPRIAALPVDERGYPVPFFVAWVNEKNEQVEPGTGKPEFRCMDAKKLTLCVRQKLCWVCGQPLGANKAFVLGPMCVVTGVTSEPPSHLDCAMWSVKGCPFLTNPDMVRREKGIEHATAAGVMIKRNPGVMAIVVARGYKPFFPGNGILFRVDTPTQPPTWWTRGRPANREEVLAAIDAGLPLLLQSASGPEQEAELMFSANRVKALVQEHVMMHDEKA